MDDQGNVDHQAAVFSMKWLWSGHFRFWLFQSNTRFFVCQGLFPIFFGCANVVMPAWKPAPREVKSIAKIAYAIMVYRVSTEYHTSKATQAACTYFEWIRANSVVQMQDYCLAFSQTTRNTDMADEDAIILRVLKSAALMKADTMTNELLMYENRWAITSCRSDVDLGARCSQFGNSDGVVADVMSRLRGPESGDDGPIVITVNKGEHRGQIAVMLSHVATPAIRTTAEEAILTFLGAEVLHSPVKLWGISYDEQAIVFKPAILSRILESHSSDIFRDSPSLRRLGVNQTSLEQAFCFLEASGEVKFRDLQTAHPHNLDETIAFVSDTNTEGSVRVDRAGVLDDLRVLGPDYLETEDIDVTDEWIASKMAEMAAADATVPMNTPTKRKRKSPIRSLNVMTAQCSVFQQELDKLVHNAHNIVQVHSPMGTFDDTLSTQERMKELWDVTVGVTGELPPGTEVFNGVDSRSTNNWEMHTIRERERPIRIANAGRHTGGGDATMPAQSIAEWLMPSSQATLTLPCTGSTMMTEVKARVAAENFATFV